MLLIILGGFKSSGGRGGCLVPENGLDGSERHTDGVKLGCGEVAQAVEAEPSHSEHAAAVVHL